MRFPHVVFLDFDGPLFSAKALMMPENTEENSPTLQALKMHPMVSYWKADPMAIAMLHELHKIRPFQIVVSSGWANEKLHSKEDIERLFKINKLNIPLHKAWRIPMGSGGDKALEISQWLAENKHSDYMILDDEDSGYCFNNERHLKDLKLNKEKIIIVDAEEGISMRNFYQMKAIVANWD